MSTNITLESSDNQHRGWSRIWFYSSYKRCTKQWLIFGVYLLQQCIVFNCFNLSICQLMYVFFPNNKRHNVLVASFRFFRFQIFAIVWQLIFVHTRAFACSGNADVQKLNNWDDWGSKEQTQLTPNVRKHLRCWIGLFFFVKHSFQWIIEGKSKIVHKS